MLSAMATIEWIYFDDEATCSSRFVSATLKLPDGEFQKVEMVREIHPLTLDEFDKFWDESKKIGFKNLIGKSVELIRKPTIGGFGYNILAWPT